MENKQYFEQMQELKKVLKTNVDYQEKYKVKDPYYNYGYREDLQKEQMMIILNLSYDEIKLHEIKLHEIKLHYKKGKSNSGPDFEIFQNNAQVEVINSGEMKAGWHKPKKLSKKNLGVAKFDKQNDDVRRNQIYEYDALIYSAFDKKTSSIKFSIFILGKERMKKIHYLMKIEQEKIIEEIKNLPVGERLSRDDIGIRILDILESLNDEDMTIVFNGIKITKEDFLKSYEEKPRKQKEKRKGKGK